MNKHVFLIGFFVYLLAMVWLGWAVSRRRNRTGDDFLLGGRSIPLLLAIGTTVATMIGTGSSMGAVGLAYEYGWSGTLYGIGGAVGLLLVALCFAPVRALRFMTMSEEFAYYAGGSRLVQNLVAVLIYLACIGWLGVHILGGGFYLAWIGGIDLWLAKVIVAVGFGVYCIIGGYLAVVWTDTVQAILLFVGFVAMAAFAVVKVGGLEHLGDHMDPAKQGFFQLADGRLLPAISLPVAVCVGVLGTPAFRQRVYSGDTVKTVRRSFALTGVVYLGFSLVPAIIGLAAHTLAPNLEKNNFAFPFLATNVLPLWLGLLVLIAGLSATMSSASSDAIAGVSILLRDLYAMVTRRTPPRERVVLYSRLAMACTVGLALLLALAADDVVNYITMMIPVVMAGLAVAGLLGRYWRRYNWQGATATLVAGSAAALAVLFHEPWRTFWGNPTIPAVTAALAAGIGVTLLTPRPRVSRTDVLARLEAERRSMEHAASEAAEAGPAAGVS